MDGTVTTILCHIFILGKSSCQRLCFGEQHDGGGRYATGTRDLHMNKDVLDPSAHTQADITKWINTFILHEQIHTCMGVGL